MNGSKNDKRSNSIPQEQFEAIAKRAAEVAVPMARDMVLEVVRSEMQTILVQKNKEAAHDLYAIIGEAGFKEIIGMVWFLIKTLCITGAIAILGYLGFKGHIIK